MFKQQDEQTRPFIILNSSTSLDHSSRFCRMFWRKKTTPPQETCGHEIYEFLIAGLRDKDGRIRAEEVINAAASIVAERSIEAAGDFNPREHKFTPGSRVFSDKINALLCGDVADADSAVIPADSIFGQLRDRLIASKYTLTDIPSLKTIFQFFAAHVGNKDDWGKVPLSIPSDHHPYMLPLRVAFETRKQIDQILAPLGNDHTAKLQATIFALTEALNAVADIIDHKIALLLAFETINGMSKTAPMADDAMAELVKQREPKPPQK